MTQLDKIFYGYILWFYGFIAYILWLWLFYGYDYKIKQFCVINLFFTAKMICPSNSQLPFVYMLAG